MADTAATTKTTKGSSETPPTDKPKYPGIRVTCNGNQLVTEHVEIRITDGGIFYPITPSTEGGEIYQQAFAQGQLNVFGDQKIAANLDALRAGLFEYTEILYNRQRRHSAIDYVSPEQFESKPNPMNVSTFLG